MFGASSSGGTGLFGSSQQKPAFGALASTGNVNSGSGFLFSSSNTNPGAGNTGSTGGFGGLGGQNSNPAGSSTPLGGLFGSSNNTQNSQSTLNLLGQNKPAGGLFGGSSNTGASNTSGGLFGGSNTANNQQQGSNTSGGLFGSSNTGTTGGGLFGKPPASSGSGPFGGSNTSTQTNVPGSTFGSSGGGLFGSSNTNNSGTSGGLFGKPNTSTPASSGGLFGGSPNQQNTQSGGLFGQSNSGPTSQQNNANPTSNTSSNLFGGSTVNNAQPSFSWSSQQQQKPPQSSLLNLPNLPNSQAPSQQTTTSSSSTYTPPINDQLIKLKEQWDPNSPKCALKTHFYNKFNQEEINALMQQQRPANESPEDWDSAMSERPSAQHYPVKITSFSDVSQRIETQLDHVAKSRILLNNINEKQTQLSSKHDLDNSTRILKAKARHTKLSRRLLRLATVLAILKLKGYPLLPEEEEISKQFQTLNSRFSDPNGPVGKLSDLYARLAILKGRSEDISLQLESSIGSIHGGLNDIMNGKEGAGVVDGTDSNNYIDQIVNQLTKLLYKQQVGLSYLNELLQKDLETVDKKLAAQS